MLAREAQKNLTLPIDLLKLTPLPRDLKDLLTKIAKELESGRGCMSAEEPNKAISWFSDCSPTLKFLFGVCLNWEQVPIGAHSRSVLYHVKDLVAQAELPKRLKLMLQWAAVLHDIGKPVSVSYYNNLEIGLAQQDYFNSTVAKIILQSSPGIGWSTNEINCIAELIQNCDLLRRFICDEIDFREMQTNLISMSSQMHHGGLQFTPKEILIAIRLLGIADGLAYTAWSALIAGRELKFSADWRYTQIFKLLPHSGQWWWHLVDVELSSEHAERKYNMLLNSLTPTT